MKQLKNTAYNNRLQIIDFVIHVYLDRTLKHRRGLYSNLPLPETMKEVSKISKTFLTFSSWNLKWSQQGIDTYIESNKTTNLTNKLRIPLPLYYVSSLRDPASSGLFLIFVRCRPLPVNASFARHETVLTVNYWAVPRSKFSFQRLEGIILRCEFYCTIKYVRKSNNSTLIRFSTRKLRRFFLGTLEYS